MISQKKRILRNHELHGDSATQNQVDKAFLGI